MIMFAICMTSIDSASVTRCFNGSSTCLKLILHVQRGNSRKKDNKF